MISVCVCVCVCVCACVRECVRECVCVLSMLGEWEGAVIILVFLWGKIKDCVSVYLFHLCSYTPYFSLKRN